MGLPPPAPQLPLALGEATRLTETSQAAPHAPPASHPLPSTRVRGQVPAASHPTWAGLNLLPLRLPTLCAPGRELRPVSLRWSTRCSETARVPGQSGRRIHVGPASHSTSLGLSFPWTPGVTGHSPQERPPLPQGPATSEPKPRGRFRQARRREPTSAGKLPAPECSAAISPTRGPEGGAGPPGSCSFGRSRRSGQSTSSRVSATPGPLVSAGSLPRPRVPGIHLSPAAAPPVRPAPAVGSDFARSAAQSSLLFPIPVRGAVLPAETVLQPRVPRCWCAGCQAPPAPFFEPEPGGRHSIAREQKPGVPLSPPSMSSPPWPPFLVCLPGYPERFLRLESEPITLLKSTNGF